VPARGSLDLLAERCSIAPWLEAVSSGRI